MQAVKQMPAVKNNTQAPRSTSTSLKTAVRSAASKSKSGRFFDFLMAALSAPAA